ncbi:Glutaredoxin 3 [hydrothermal vent metagenome]|uniref:Glutaredoxin 3 n=1 Tax=hydrothermal vent metagenome TaxID=652676 RepID=A0A3B0VU19_9ZZZZ
MLDYLNLNIACEPKEALNYPVNTESKNNHEILIYSTLMCPYCSAAKQLLKNKNLDYQEIRVNQDRQQRQIMMEKSGRTSVPQIFINNQHVGGFDDLYALNRAGKLDQILGA